jgi:uncharacterized protein (TIGR03437 family)
MRLSKTLLPGALFVSVAPFAYAQYFLACSPSYIYLPQSVGTQLNIVEGSGAHVRFQYAGVTPGLNNPPNFTVVVPSSGTTPAAVTLGLNPSVVAQMQPGGVYGLGIGFTTVDQNPPVSTSCGPINFTVPAEPAPSIQSVVNAASFQPSLSPGALVSIFGSYLSGPTQSTDYGATASYPTSVASTSVTFNGIAAPLIYVSPSQINAIVPFALAGQTSAQVVVQRFQQVSATFTLPLQNTSPGIFTATQSGSGQGAILQESSGGQFSYNGSANPAPAGTALEIFATGAGAWTPPAQSDVFLYGESFTTQPVSVTIGGQPANVLYAGTLGEQSSWSVLQVNAVMPDGLASGPQPLVLKIGANDNSQQNVTVWAQ